MWYNDGMKRKWFLKYVPGLLIALLVFWGFYGFVKNDNWLAVSALATLILALGAFLAIWLNHNLQKRERRDRLLNEIIEWAIDVAAYELKHESVNTWSFVEFKEFINAVVNSNVEYMRHLRKALVRCQYIGAVALRLDETLSQCVKSLVENIEEHTSYLVITRDDKPSLYEQVENKVYPDKQQFQKWQEACKKVEQHKTQLSESAYKVVEQATILKTKEIT